MPSGSQNQLKVAEAMQEQRRVLESENENLKQRIDQLESENDYNPRGGAIMNNYVDEMGNKSYLSSEMMWFGLEYFT